jgi:hypothetical protein
MARLSSNASSEQKRRGRGESSQASAVPLVVSDTALGTTPVTYLGVPSLRVLVRAIHIAR